MSEKSQSQKPSHQSPVTKYYLYLDTSEPEATIAVYECSSLRGSEADVAISLIKEEKWQAHRELANTLLKKYSDILKNMRIDQKDLAGICVFKGPGSFTGLRIGISFANGLAYGLKIPIYGTSKQGELDLSKPEKIIVPEYGSEPKITKSKKEHLK